MSAANVKKIGFGGLLYWQLPEYTDRQRVTDELSKLNLGYEKLVPGERPASALLKEAMMEVFAGSRTLVRPLKLKNGFAAVRENRGDGDNTYASDFIVKVDEGTGALDCSSMDIRKAKVEAAYAAQRGRMNNNEVTAVMLKIITEKLSGIALRARGGLYWIPGVNSATWNLVKDALEKADANIQVYFLEHDVGPEYLRAVKDAIVHEVSTESARLTEEIQGNKSLGKRALQSKKKEADALEKKVTLYESLLSETFTGLKGKLSAVEMAADMATLLLSAAPVDDGNAKV